MFGALAVWIALIAGCTDPVARSQLLVVIDAEDAVRQRVRYVEVEVRGGSEDDDAWELVQSSTLMPSRSGSGWPLDFTVAQARTGSSYMVTAWAKAEDDTTVTVVRARKKLARGRTLELKLQFDAACAAREVLCPNTFSCNQGKCVDPAGDEAALPIDQTDAATATDGSTPPGETEVPPTEADAGCSGDACCSGGRDCAKPCTARDERGVCLACPSGYLELGMGKCSPALSGLELDGAQLTPPFEPARTSYAAELGFIATVARLRLAAADSIELLVNGSPAAPGKTLEVPLVIGDNDVVITTNAVAHPSRSYRLGLRRGGSQRARLTSTAAVSGDAFGAGLAVSGDRLLVGAPFDDGEPGAMLTEAGAAHVLERTAAGWSEPKRLAPETPVAGSRFGQSVAIDGDRLAVGAPEVMGGAVHVFELAAGEWKPVATLREPGSVLLGRSVALQGDTLFVGDPGDAASMRAAGAVHVYERDAGGWRRTDTLRAARPRVEAWLGSSLAFTGNTLCTGATGPLDASGTVVCFERQPGGWREITTLVPDPAEIGGCFGTTLAMSGDDLAVGAFNGTLGLTGGIVYVYERRADGTYGQTSVLRPTNTRAGDYFGSSVALAGDLLVIGASAESTGASGLSIPAASGESAASKSGAVYLFERQAGAWRQTAQLKSDAPQADEELGRNVAISGEEILVAAPSDVARSGRSDRAGAVYVFR